MIDKHRSARRALPLFPWQAYHRALRTAQLNRRFYLQGLVTGFGRGMRTRFCSRVHRLNIGLC
jgi:hypothetical protein